MAGQVARIAAALCWVWLAVAGAYAGWRFTQGLPVDTDIQSMLPAAGDNPVEKAALDQAARAAAGRVAVLVTGDGAETAAADLVARLSAGGAFIPDADDGETTARWLFANRNELLCGDPAAFDEAAGRKTARSALAQIYSVAAPVSGDMLRDDPFLLTLKLAGCLAPAPQGRPTDNQRLVSGRLGGSAFAMQDGDSVVARYESWAAEWAPKGVTSARSGAVFHAARAADKAKGDIGLIGSISAIGVAALFFAAFRRVSSVLIALGLVGVGTTAGLAATLMVFPTVHVLVFVFAAMLVGVISDYAVHTMATGPATGWAPAGERQALVGRPITVSMATTVLGFGALAIFGVPLFQQVALLSGVGVITAWAFVLFVLIPLDRRPRAADRLQAAWTSLEDARDRLRIPPAASLAAVAVVAGLAIWGALNLKASDDVRDYQPRPVDLMADEAALKAAGYGGASGVFLLSEGATPAEAKAAEEAALAEAPEGVRLLAASRFDPSPDRRAENRRVLREFLYRPLLGEHVEAVGLDPAETGQGTEAVRDAAPPPFLAELAGEAGGRHYLIAPVLDAAGWAGPSGPGSRLVNPADRFTAAFGEYRVHALWAALAAGACAVLAVLAVFRTPWSLAILAPPVLACAAGMLVPAAFGLPVSFFSAAGLLVLLGVGIDYSAFEWEAGLKPDRWTAVAVTIDALTTLLSMGLLGISDTLPVRSFGLTVAVGVAVAMCLSYIPRRVARVYQAKKVSSAGSDEARNV